MRRVLENVRLLVLGVVAGALLAVVPAQAGAASTVSTYSVPVTTPDSLGAAVSLDTDVYVPDGNPPSAGFPLIEMFHGGGSTKDNGYDAAHARGFADDGYVVVSYSARGHGNSGGQTSVAGPAEIRDLFDVTAWASARRDTRLTRTSTSTARGSPWRAIRRAACTRTSGRCGATTRRSIRTGTRSAPSSPGTHPTWSSMRWCRTAC